MEIPAAVAKMLQTLHTAGYEAQLVGGCVRDMLLGTWPHDWDICTSALPEETMACFSAERVIPTGLRHGTITVVSGGIAVEITTYRTEEGYGDHRRPDKVQFVASFKEDVARRDFTINAMAWRPGEGVIDFFGGREDLRQGIIRCVGEPLQRLEEDALRILRALRFAARLGFTVDDSTAQVMEAKKELLTALSAERVYSELTGLLRGKYCAQVLECYGGLLLPVLPELPVGHSAWTRTLTALGKAGDDLFVRWTLLLQKPEGGSGPERADSIFKRLKADNETRRTVCTLLQWSSIPVKPEKAELLQWLNRLGEENLCRLLEVQRCNGMESAVPASAALEHFLQEKPCYCLSQLAVNGGDLQALGIPRGPELGRVLQELLQAVMAGECSNEREALLARAGREKGGKGCSGVLSF